MTDAPSYHDYLRNRSRYGLWYRANWLYPRIVPHLTGRTIDIGCGIGDMLRFRPGTIGVDIDAQNVAYCRDQGLEAHPMDPDTLPFPDADFDSALLDNVLEHIAEPLPLLAEIHRIVRVGGTLVVAVPGQRGFDSDDDHKVFYDEAALLARVTETGFAVRTTFHTPLRSALLAQRLRQYCVYGVFARLQG